MTKTTLFAIIFICSTTSIFAQAGWNWGQDEATAKEKNALYTDRMKNGNLEGAVEPLEWLLTNTPDLNASIYINGAKIYDELQEKTKDASKKKQYQTRALELYDMRIQHFNKEATVLNRKAYTAYKYLKDDPAKLKELYDLFERTFELNGNKTLVSNLVAYMDVIRRYRSKAGFTDDDVLEKYGIVSEILTNHIQKAEEAGKSTESLIKNQGFVDKMLVGMLENMDCNTVGSKMAPGLQSNPQDVVLAKRIIALSLTYKCTDQPYFLEAAKIVFNGEPTFGMGKLIAVKSDAAKDYDTAQEFYEKTAELAKNDKQKADIQYALANHYRARGLKSRARSTAYDALKLDPAKKEAYKLIGDLYMTSYDDCRQGVSKVDDRGVFLAAYEMYKRAGDSRGMANAEKQFPSMEEMFELSLEEGQTIQVGCWINESVTLKRRPSS